MAKNTRAPDRKALGLILSSWILTLSGCQTPPPAGQTVAAGGIGQRTASPFSKFDLRDRAENLLLEASRSEIDLLAANAVEALEKVAPSAGKARFQALLDSDSALVRFAAATAIGNTRDRTALPRLQKRFSDPDPRVRLAVNFAGARLGQREKADVLLRTLTSESNENLRSDAAFLLGKLGEPRARKRLESALLAPINKKSNRVAVHIYGAMAELGDKDAIQNLIAFTAGDVVSRVLALQMLAEVAPPDAQKALHYVLGKKDEYLENRLLAARGLGKMGNRSGFKLALDSLGYVGKNAEDASETARVQQLAALALGSIRSPDALDRLRDLAQNSIDERVQVAACYAICQIVGE